MFRYKAENSESYGYQSTEYTMYVTYLNGNSGAADFTCVQAFDGLPAAYSCVEDSNDKNKSSLSQCTVFGDADQYLVAFLVKASIKGTKIESRWCNSPNAHQEDCSAVQSTNRTATSGSVSNAKKQFKAWCEDQVSGL